MQADIDLMRDVYMTRTQREAYERILAIAEGAEVDRADAEKWRNLAAKMQRAAEPYTGDAALAGAVTQGQPEG